MQGKTFETSIWGISIFFALLLLASQDAQAGTGNAVLEQAQSPSIYIASLVVIYISVKLLGAPRGQL